MKARGFTALELAIVVSISALTVPLVYLFLRTVTATSDEAFFRLEVAGAVRTLGEQLDADRLRPECQAQWRLEPDGALHRAATEACGGDRVLATRVTKLERSSDGVMLTFTRPLHPERAVSVDVFLAGALP